VAAQRADVLMLGVPALRRRPVGFWLGFGGHGAVAPQDSNAYHQMRAARVGAELGVPS
jgi:hypothetical protein